MTNSNMARHSIHHATQLRISKYIHLPHLFFFFVHVLRSKVILIKQFVRAVINYLSSELKLIIPAFNQMHFMTLKYTSIGAPVKPYRYIIMSSSDRCRDTKHRQKTIHVPIFQTEHEVEVQKKMYKKKQTNKYIIKIKNQTRDGTNRTNGDEKVRTNIVA